MELSKTFFKIILSALEAEIYRFVILHLIWKTLHLKNLRQNQARVTCQLLHFNATQHASRDWFEGQTEKILSYSLSLSAPGSIHYGTNHSQTDARGLFIPSPLFHSWTSPWVERHAVKQRGTERNAAKQNGARWNRATWTRFWKFAKW